MDALSRILVVDDEPALCQIMAVHLRDAGFDITEAHCANDAIELFQTRTFQLILSDVRMQNGDGISLLKFIGRKACFQPVLFFVTAFSDLTLEQAYHLGAEAYFSKPVDYESVISKVQEHLVSIPERWQKGVSTSEHENVFELMIESSQAQSSKEKTFSFGRGGIFFRCVSTFPKIGQSMSFVINDSIHSKTISGRGVCRWIREKHNFTCPPGVGMEFVEIKPEHYFYLKSQLDEDSFDVYIPMK